MPRDMIRRQTKMAKETRAASFAPTSYDPENHTVELEAATGYEVARWSWDGQYLERLQISDDAIDLSRVAANQCPALDTHNTYSIDDQLGKIIAGRVENNILILTLQFAQTPRGQEIEARVASGELSGCSVGYRRIEMVLAGTRDDVPIYEVTQWMLLECSLCPVPADPDSGVRSASLDDLHPCLIIERNAPAMPTIADILAAQATLARSGATDAEIAAANEVLARARAAEATRTTPAPTPAPAPVAAAPVVVPAAEVRASPVAVTVPADVRMTIAEGMEFVDAARGIGIAEADARTWATTMTPEAARAEMIRAAAARNNDAAPRPAHGQAARIGTDDRDHFRAGLENVMLHRTAPGRNPLDERGRSLMGRSLMDIGRDNLAANGVRVQGMNKRELARNIMANDAGSRAMGVSDFPNILGNVTGRTLRTAYEMAGQTFKIWQRRTTAPDFKQITRLQLSAAPGFIVVPEGGEYTYGYLGEAKEVYQLAKYGRLMAFTYEMLINDDLGAFVRIVEMMGNAAAQFESDVAYAPLLGNPNMGDGYALFSTQHGNYVATGSGSAPSEASVSAAEQAMTSQVGLSGPGETARVMSIPPQYIIGGYKYRVPFKKLTASVTPNNTADVNAYDGALTPVLEARLNSLGAWFLAADYNRVDTIEYCYLDGDDGVFMDERVGFEVDQIEYKARLEFASKAIDYRGLSRNDGQ